MNRAAEPLSFAGSPALRISVPAGGFRHAAIPERGLALWLVGAPQLDDAPEAAATLLRAFAERGHAVWSEQRGRFAAIVREDQPARIHVATDRRAAIPVYRCANGDGVALAFSLGDGVRSGLLPLAWDRHGVAEQLVLGQCLGARTALAGVERLAKASVTTFDRASSKETTERYWSAERVLAGPREPFAARRDELVARFREAVEAHAAKGAPCTTLSGGLDTRVIAATLVAAGHRPLALTAGVPGGSDDRVARRVAAALGLEHRFVAIDAASIGAPLPLMREAAVRLDGRGLVEGVGARRIAHAFPPGATVFQGGFAELAKLEGAHEVRIRFGRVPAAEALPGSIAGCFARNDAVIRPLLAPALRNAVAPLDTLAGCVRGALDRLEPVEALTWFYLEERLEQSVASHAMYGDRVAAPFADPFFLDALLCVRGRDRIRPRFHQYLLGRLAPQLLAIPDSNTALPAWAPGPARDLGRALQIAALKLGLSFAQAHDDFRAKLARLEPDVRTLLRNGRLMADGVLDPAGVDALCGQVDAGSEHTASMLQRVLIFDLWAASLTDAD
jgi:hypothetical protein